MAVYVDELQGYDTNQIKEPARRYGRQWCHLFAGSEGDIEELHQFAAKLGLKRAWFQDARRWQFKHYDLTPNKRELAIRLGALVTTAQERGRQTADQIAAEVSHASQG